MGPAAPPVSTGLPAVTGTFTDGQTLNVTNGTWTGAATITYTRKWLRCDTLGASCADTGASSTTYKLTPADVGSTVRVAVTAVNPDGTASATSDASVVVAPLAPKNTAPPTVTGTARDLQTLTAATGTWTGTTPLAYAYQWQRCDSSGASCVAIPGASAGTYAIDAADIGSTLRVQVTATNAAGAVTATSGATAIVAAAPPVNTVLPGLSGTARDQLTLTASTGTWTGTALVAYTYQWRRCSSAGSSCVDITGATGATYALTPADVGATVRVKVVATNVAGSANVLSALSAVVAPAPPVSTAVPAIAGSAVDGTVLTASTGGWTGTPALAMTYRWERCDALLNCQPITGATLQTYTLTPADVGSSVRVVATATNGAGTASATSAATAAVAPLAPRNTALPTIAGVTRDGSTVTASTGTWAGTTPLAFAYQWRRCDTTGAGCVDVPGATGATYVQTSDDVAGTLRVVVTATGRGGTTSAASAFTPIVAALAPSNTIPPAITGVARDGRTLTAQPGDWTGTPSVEMAYQWRRCDATGAKCSDVVGAVNATYVVTTADVGSTLRAVVAATNAGGTGTATTAATGVVQGNPPVNLTSPTVTGTVMDGELLTAVDGTWTGVVTIGFDHQWWRCDAAGANCGIVAGATQPTYRVSGTDVGLTLRVEVIARNAGGATSAFSDATPVGQPAPPMNTAAPSIGGHHGVGELLEAARGTWVGSPTIAYAYQWERCDADGGACADLPGEDSDAYRLTAADLGVTLRVKVTGSNPAGSATAESSASAIVRDDPPVDQGLPAVTGDLVAEGVPVGADDGTWAGFEPMTASHRWQRCDANGNGCTDLTGATVATYTPVTADVGSTLRVVVTMDNGVGVASATSLPSDPVKAAPPRNTVPPLVTPTGLRPGKDLAGTNGTWVGAKPIGYTLQWLRCDLAGGGCQAVQDATTLKYTLTGADIGHLLRLRVTAANGTASVDSTSQPVGPVLALPPSTAGKPKVTVDGKPHVGSVLRADAGTWTGTDPIVFAYQWQQCVSSTDCRDVAGATGGEYTAAAADVGRKLRVVVRAANSGGTASAESAASDTVSGSSPLNRARPTVAGTVRDGATLTAAPGTWAGTAPFDFKYAWEQCTSATCKPIKGAEAATYRLTAADVGQRIAVKVTATNAFGRADAESVPSAVVDAIRPLSRKRPTVSRLPTELEKGLKLRGRPGRWTGTDPITYAYQWLRCDKYGSHCRMLKKATDATYTLVAKDLKGARLRHPLRLAVTATNQAGERTALSAAVGAVRRPPPVRVSFASRATLKQATSVLTITTTCTAGATACIGTLRAAGKAVEVQLPAGASTSVMLGRVRTPLASPVAVRFASSGRPSGRSVDARLRVHVVKPKPKPKPRKRPPKKARKPRTTAG